MKDRKIAQSEVLTGRSHIDDIVSGVSLRQQKEALSRAGIVNLGSRENAKAYLAPLFKK